MSKIGGIFLKKAISILLIIIGVLVLLIPLFTEQIVDHYSKSVLNEDISKETLKANNKNNTFDAEFDFSAVENVDIKSVIRASQNFNEDLVIGTLSIPSLKINLPIMKGLSDANLMVGAATMKPDQSLGVGNYTLAGHHMKKKDLLFGNLMNIKIGDMIFISDGNKIYKYKIYDTVISPDTNIDMLSDKNADKRGKPIISLMTCYFSSNTGKRFFALGELVDESPVD